MNDTSSASAAPPPRVGVVVVTHGQLATEIVNAAEMIVGDIPHVAAVSIGWHDHVDDALESIKQAVQRVDAGSGVLVLTDMFGGTPANLAMTLLAPNRVEVVTGVNLPMLVKVARAETVADLAREVADSGRSAIWVASELMRVQGKP